MSSDSLVMVLVLCIGVLFVVFRRSAAEIAVRQHEALYGRRWGERTFELWFALAGVFFIAFAVLALLGVTHER